jgi:hypothetical protein
MEDSTGDYHLKKNLEELVKLKIRMSNALERSDRDDYNNNSIMASMGLNDYHNLQKEYEDLLERVKKVIKKMPEEKVLEMCRMAEDKVQSCWW